MATDDIFPSKYGDFFHFFLEGIFLQFALVSFLSPKCENSLQNQCSFKDVCDVAKVASIM
jgi:hypothetical protein